MSLNLFLPGSAGKALILSVLLTLTSATNLINRTTILNFSDHNPIILQAPLSATVPASGYCFTNSGKDKYRCPGTQTCTSNYHFCPYLDKICTDTASPFRCFNTSGLCVSDMSTQCCETGVFCPHLRKCVATAADCCSLNSTTPIYCSATGSCVSHAH